MDAVPNTLTEVTPAWLTSALRERWPEIEVRGVDARPIGEGIGQLSLLARLTIDHVGARDAPDRMVIKLPAVRPSARSIPERYRAYEREVNFYRRFASRVPIDTPDVYCARTDGPSRFVLLIEDLSGLRVVDQIRGASLSDTEIAVDRLAGLAASFWRSQALAAESEWLPDWEAAYYRPAASEYAACVPEYLRRLGAVLPEGGGRAVRAIAERFAALLDALNRGATVLTHYDFRVENMFFGSGAAPRLVVIDWQFLMRCRHGWDFAYLLGTNLDPELRRRHADALKERYYAALLRHGVRDYSRADLDFDVALGTLGMTVHSVVGGSNADFSQPRSAALLRTIAYRTFCAVLDDDCLAVLP